MTPELRPEGHRAITRGDKGWKEHSNRGNSSEVKKKSPCTHFHICVILNNKKLFFLKLQSKAPLPPPSPKKSHGDYFESSVLSRRVTGAGLHSI